MAIPSDHDRELAVRALGRHYVSGRLSVDDLNRRLGAVLRARRRHEIASAFGDLPPVWRDREELERLGRAATSVVKRGVYLGAVAAAWMTINAMLLVAFVVAAAVHAITPLEVVLLPVAWLATTVIAFRAARHR